jgi:hypothetical protein
MTWNWYAIKKIDETMSKNTPDETITIDLGAGDEVIRFIKGFSVGIIFRNYLLFPNTNSRNPYNQADLVGAFIKNGIYWVGINVGEE